MVARWSLPEDLLESVSDVIRALCLKDKLTAQQTLKRILTTPPSLVRHGPMREDHLKLFLNAATRDAPLSRSRFRGQKFLSIGFFFYQFLGIKPLELS